MASFGAVDLYSGSTSIAGPNLWQADKNPLNELDEGIAGPIGEQAKNVGGALWTSMQTIVDQILGIQPTDPNAQTSLWTDISAMFTNVWKFLGGTSPGGTGGSLNPTDPNFDPWASLVTFIESFIPSNLLAPIVTDPNSSGGVTGFIPLENLALAEIESIVGGAQQLVDAILASIGIPAGSGTTTQVDQYFKDLLSMLANPDLTVTSTPHVTSTGAWSGVHTTASLAVPIPTGGSVGNVDLVLVWADSTTVTATPPSGFVWPPGTWPHTTTSTPAFQLWVWSHDVSTIATGNYTVTLSGSAPCHGIALRLGATQTALSIFDAAPVVADAAGAAATPAVTSTTTATNDLLLWASWKFSGSTTHTFPTGYTSLFGSSGGTNGDTTGASAQLMVANATQAATGTTGAVSGAWDHPDAIAAMLIPLIAKSAFDPMAAIEDFIANMLHPTNMLAPMDSLTSLLFPANVPPLDASKITTGTLLTALIPNLPASIVSSGTFLASLIPGLDATKIVSGILSLLQIPLLPASQTTTGTFGAGLIPTLDASKITTGTLLASLIPNLNASIINAGTFVASLIPGLDATKITSGILNLLQIPLLPASQTNTGTFAGAQIPSLDASKITTGTLLTALIPNLPASIVNSGTFLASLIPGLDATKIVSGVMSLLQIPLLPASQTTTGTFLAGLIPGLDASKITSGLFSQSQIAGLVNDIAAMLTNTSPLNAQNLFNQVESDLIGLIPVSHVANTNPNLLSSAGFDSASSVNSPGWTWNGSDGHTTTGCAQATANGTVLSLFSNIIPVAQNQTLSVGAWVKYTGLAATAGQNAIRVNVAAYLGSTLVSTTMVASIASPTGTSAGWVQLSGTPYTVPANVDNVLVQLVVTAAATAGTVEYDDASCVKTGLMSGNWMTGISSTVAADFQNMVDQIYRAMFGGTSTGNSLSTILTALTNVPGPNIVTNLLASVIPGLDATKITSGVFPQAQVSGLVADIAAMLTNTSPLNAQNLFNQVESDLIGLIPYSHIGAANPNLLSSSGFDSASSVNAVGWTWNGAAGHTSPGCAQATANGTVLTLFSPSAVQVTQGQALTVSAWVNYTGLTATAGQNALRINVAGYLGTAAAGITMVAAILSPTGSSAGWVQMTGSYTVPAGVDNIVVQLQVTADATAGTVQYDDASATKTGLMSGSWLYSALTATQATPPVPIASTIAADTQAMVDAITNAFQGVENLFGTSINVHAQPAMSGVLNNVVNNSTAIQGLTSQQTGNAASGQAFTVNFANYPNGAMPSIFTVNYSGTGGSTIAISGGQAVWNMVSGADRAAILIYNGANASPATPSVTNTDYQLIGATVAGAMGYSGASAANYLFGRVKDTNNYVYAKYTTNGLLGFFAELGCVVGGTPHVFATGIPVPITTTQWLYCGTGSGANYYQLMAGTQVLQIAGQNAYHDVANVAQVGPAFRGWGWGGLTAGSGAASPAAGTGVSCADNAPPSVVGSGALMVRHSTTQIATAFGPAVFPANFYDSPQYNSADIQSNAANGSFTVANAGWYMVNIAAMLPSATYSTNFSACLFRTPAGGSSALAQVAGGAYSPEGILQGSFLIYLGAGDMVQAGYATNNIATAITGEGTGAYSYFNIALANKSFA